MKYLLNCISFIFLMVLFSFFDNFGMDSEEKKATWFKVIFVGDAGVGKTQIINRISNDTFSEVYEPSIGVDFWSKNILFRGQNIKLQMWDAAGQERYKGLIPTYMRNSSIVFVIFDVSTKTSFDNIPNWINFIRTIENTTLVLCGNKIDLAEREVKREEGEALAQKEGIAYFEVSAKTGDNIKNMFYNSVADLPTFSENNSNKENLVKELLQENENKNENENKADSKNTERCSLCSRCIVCCKNCFNSD